jgi:molybdopterin-containing oxidoreductase family iron-sulfur binding subunit
VRDGEIQTACAQSCPTQAITFGDLADPESAVHEKSFGERRYWVFEECTRSRRHVSAAGDARHGGG